MPMHRPRPSFFALAILVALLPLLATASPERGETPSQPTEETDLYGRVIRDADGRAITYGESQTDGLDPVLAPESERPRDVEIDRLFRHKSSGPVAVDLEWHRSIYGVGIGATGLHVTDLDGDGAVEIVAGGGKFGFFRSQFWYVLQEAGGTYPHRYTSPFYTDYIEAIRTVDLDADGDSEVIVGQAGTIRVFDDFPPVETAILSVPGNDIIGLRTADVDADGALEHVYCDSSSLYVVDASTGALERSQAYAGTDLAIGDVDGDGALEIVVTGLFYHDGNDVVLDAATGALEWTNPTGFGDIVRVADLDGDGRDEIVAADRWDFIRTWDADTRTLVHSITTDHDIDSLEIFDPDGDGDLEIVYGDGQWGAIYFHDGTTGALERTITNPNHGVTDIAFGDVDADGSLDLLWGSGFSSSGADYLRVYDLASASVEWQNLDITGPFYAQDFGDVDADGAPELISGSFESESGYGDGLYFVHDAQSHELEYTSPEPTGSNWMGVYRARPAQIDDDPQLEIFLTTSSTYTPKLIAYDGLDHSTELTITGESGLYFAGLQVVDIDLDGALEVVASTGREHTGPDGVVVEIYDAATGALEWRSPFLATNFSYFPFLRVAEMDGDASPEIVVGRFDGGYWIFDGVTRAIERSETGNDLTALDTADLDADGVAELVVGRDTGAVEIIDAATGAIVESIYSGSGPIQGLDVIDVDADGHRDYVFVDDGYLRIVDGFDHTILHAGSEFLGDLAGRWDSILAADVDGDSRIEVWVNLGYQGTHLYELPGSVADSAPTLSITQPTDGAQFDSHQVVTLSATALDAEDGDLSAGVQWISNLDGLLATGSPATVSLSEGTHAITARVVDGGGHPVSTAITLEIVSDPPPPAVADYLARWRFDGDLTDASGNGHDGTAEGGVDFGEGVENQGLFAAGGGDRVRVAAHPDFDTLSALTVTAWVKAEPDARWRSIVDKRDANADGFDLFLNSSGGRAYLRVNGSTLTGTTDVDDGAWHHVAGVWDGAELRLYVDGVLDGTAAGAAGTVSTTADLLVAGHFSNTGYDLAGYESGSLDDVRVWDRALDAAEITTVLDEIPPRLSDLRPANVLPSGTTSTTLSLVTDEPAECRAGDAAGNPAWADLAIALVTADDLFHEASLTGLSAGTLDLVVVCRDLDWHETAPVAAPIVIAGATDVHLGLAGYWTLDEGAGTLAADSSGNGRDGVVAGATWATSPRGSALEFTASGDQVVVSNDATLGQPETVTMAAWIRVDGGSGFRSIIDVRDGNIDGYDLFVSDTGRAFLRVDNEKITGTTAIDDGAWHHVVGVYDGADLVLYVDGTEDARLVGAGTLGIDVGNDLVIGDHFSGSGSYGFRGAIDEVRVYDRVLGVAEIQHLAAQ